VAEETKRTVSLGGAALVVRNLLELGAEVHFVTLVGKDEEAELIRSYSHPRLQTSIICDPTRKTTAKKRYWVDGYKLLQFDTLDRRELGKTPCKQLLECIREEVEHCDLIAISDYRHGILPTSVAKQIVASAKRANKILIVDSQVSQSKSNHKDYAGAWGFCLNEKETVSIDPHFVLTPKSVSFKRLRLCLKSDNIIIKRGENGSVALMGKEVHSVPAIRARAVDPCGAGDAFFAALCLGDFLDPISLLTLSNTWAGLSTEHYGPNPPKYERLEQWLAESLKKRR
jgi:D-beta-D-heptose 7-phosphate kinase/D-beta-D-heptose 1-phosphate adenosyltransferase